MNYGELPYSAQDAGVYPYAAGVPGTLVDMAGIRSIGMTPQIQTSETRGDDAVLATAAQYTSVDLSIELARLNLATIAALAGGTVTTTGTGDTAVTKLSRKPATDVVPDYKVVAQTRAKDVAGGATRFTFGRVQWSGGPDTGLTDNEFANVTITARAIPDSTGELFVIENYATWTAFAA